MVRMLVFVFGLLVLGCEQRTDFDACVEYYTDRAYRDPAIPEKSKEVTAAFYVQEKCSLK